MDSDKEVDIIGLHRLIVCLQRSPEDMMNTIHLSNLGVHKVTFGNRDWYRKATADGFDPSSFMNHQSPNIPHHSDWHQKDPAFRCFASIVQLVTKLPDDVETLDDLIHKEELESGSNE